MVECGFILYGDINDLLKVEKYIEKEYDCITLVRLVYSKDKLIFVERYGRGVLINTFVENFVKIPDNVYFALLLCGKMESIIEIGKYINKSPVELCLGLFSETRMDIVKESLWDDYVDTKIEDSKEYKEKYKAFLPEKEGDNEG